MFRQVPLKNIQLPIQCQNEQISSHVKNQHRTLLGGLGGSIHTIHIHGLQLQLKQLTN